MIRSLLYSPRTFSLFKMTALSHTGLFVILAFDILYSYAFLTRLVCAFGAQISDPRRLTRGARRKEHRGRQISFPCSLQQVPCGPGGGGVRRGIQVLRFLRVAARLVNKFKRGPGRGLVSFGNRPGWQGGIKTEFFISLTSGFCQRRRSWSVNRRFDQTPLGMAAVEGKKQKACWIGRLVSVAIKAAIFCRI